MTAERWAADEKTLDRMRYRTVVHLFGFLTPDSATLKDPSDLSVSLHIGSVRDVAAGVMKKAIEQGYEPVRTATVWGDGIVQMEFRVPNRPEHADLPMWHLFTALSDRWSTA